MAIFDALLDKESQFIELSHLLISPAHMAFGGHMLSDTVAMIAGPLELLNESWPQSPSLCDNTLTIAMRTNMDILWTVSPISSAMRANGHFVVCYGHLSPIINILKCDSYFDSCARPHLLLLSLPIILDTC